MNEYSLRKTSYATEHYNPIEFWDRLLNCYKNISNAFNIIEILLNLIFGIQHIIFPFHFQLNYF